MNSLSLSDAYKLAIHSLSILAEDRDRRYTTQQIADLLQASPHHLAKVHTRLVRSGVLSSVRGPNGGLALSRDPQEVSLLEIHHIIDGEIDTTSCLFTKPVCGRKRCIFGTLIRDVNTMVFDYLKETTLADLVV